MNAFGTLVDLLIKLRVDGADMDRKLSEAEKKAKASADRIADIWDKAGKAAAVGFAVGTAAIVSFAKDAAGAETSVERLRSTLRNLGQGFEDQLPQIREWAAQLSKAADFDDEALLDQMREMVTITGDVREAQLAVSAATNLANQTNGDLAASLDAVRGGYLGQARALRGYGIVLGEGVQGHNALLEVMSKVRGANESTASSTERAWRRMTIELGNAREELGTALLPTVQVAIEWLRSLAGWINNLSEEQKRGYASALLYTTGALGIIAVLGQTVGPVVTMIQQFQMLAIAKAAATAAGAEFGTGMTALAAPGGPIALVIAAVAALGFAFDKLSQKAREALADARAAVEALNAAANTAPVAVGQDPQGNPIYESGADASKAGFKSGWQRLADITNPFADRSFSIGKLLVGPLAGLLEEGYGALQDNQAGRRLDQYQLRNRLLDPTPGQRQRERENAGARRGGGYNTPTGQSPPSAGYENASDYYKAMKQLYRETHGPSDNIRTQMNFSNSGGR